MIVGRWEGTSRTFVVEAMGSVRTRVAAVGNRTRARVEERLASAQDKRGADAGK